MSLPVGERRLRRARSRAAAVAFVFAWLMILQSPAVRAECETLKAGETLWVRLLDPLSSYSGKTGEKIRAIVIESPECRQAAAIAAGTPVSGEIKFVRKLGMGVLHETAALRVEFNRMTMKDGSEVGLAAQLVEIDNAREKVKKGVIHGVNATDAPEGRITGRLMHLPEWDPYSHVALIAYRVAFPFFPEPEIYLPRGSDLKLELTAELKLPELEQDKESALSLGPDEITRSALELAVAELPERTTTDKGRESDIVNLAFLGTREQMDAAFRAAGWTNSAPTTTKSVLREMHAIMTFENYPELPMSTQLVDGQSAATTWEKGLDSYQKREHLRVWSRTDVVEGQTIWLAAMTRETGAGLSLRQRKFIHHIDADVDEGRRIVVRDLSLAGCVSSTYSLQRPHGAHAAMNATGDPMWTDGAVAVVELKDCENPVFARDDATPEIATRPKSKMARYLRMEMLNIKTDLVRSNMVYGAFDFTRMILRSRRRRAENMLMAERAEKKLEQRNSAVVGDADSPVKSAFLNGY